ncbi:DUF2683 family protein [Lunatimonas salinarum]|uniref:DUF2683 family protein n=1 Tax=Lunatimonas salinarum TaxID=1774590 RepID=UPI001ADFE01C|nr:DUF2683 family protein [Lunatimonas salinarum]
MNYLIVHPDNEAKLNAIKAVLKALDVAFEEGKGAYNPAFEEKIKEGEKDIQSGRTVKVTLDDIWK